MLHGLCEGPDSEDVRILQTVVDGIPIVNTYVPQGHKVGTDRYVFKLEWFHRVRRYFTERLDPAGPALWMGDLNVAPEPIDVYHPDSRVNDPDFHIDAREAYKHAVDWGFTDVFRQFISRSCAIYLLGLFSQRLRTIIGAGASITFWRLHRSRPSAVPRTSTSSPEKRPERPTIR